MSHVSTSRVINKMRNAFVRTGFINCRIRAPDEDFAQFPSKLHPNYSTSTPQQIISSDHDRPILNLPSFSRTRSGRKHPVDRRSERCGAAERPPPPRSKLYTVRVRVGPGAGVRGVGREDVSQWKAISLRSLRRKEVKREEIKSGTGKMYEELFPNQLERAREA
jgi:hypothetical protein